ncbi:Fe-S cluster assembly protein SufD [[Phormidium ambiguum] IAM M-71]|uniref:Fe-S cluster assembly protein SufD n=1 Tax=[Phormidium ambiguum] IAM M-71 TaxID=454136 RepID=A0A1U7ISC3_9CYAN|nr:Fe-S cluster assembly protein SufD [Phormidium ambiguum]OKH40411.1 Fe-S cluster assembly protein SufD [Phormidium ambiguum IAM M-71]
MIAQVANRESFLPKLVNQYRKLEKDKHESCAYGLKDLRDAAAEYLLGAKFPTTKDEEWRFTDISPLLEIPLQVPELTQEPNLAFSSLSLPVSSDDELPLRVVFVNGYYAPHLSTMETSFSSLEFFVGNLSNAPENYQTRIRELLNQEQQYNDVFTALNIAGLADAAVVYVPKNQQIETPIHLLFITMPGETPILAQPHCLIVAESGSSVTVVEDFAVIGNVATFTNAVTQIWLGENAAVNHIRLQREGREAIHVGRSAIAQSRDSRYTCNAISLGGKISRHNLEVFQTGEQTETTINGLTMIAGEQLSDTHSAINLTKPHGTTRQLHKCIVADKAHAVFNGKVFVPQAAQLTDAAQLNRNLLLSPKARVDTKPQLEITADNVKCSHGATVSQLDAEEVFYLQSRGLNENDSRNLLINAFAAEIINKLPITSLRKTLYSVVKQMER